MGKEQRTYISYLSYLLRLYRVRSEGTWVWRASLEDPLSGKRQSFPNLQALLTFLEAETRVKRPGGEEESE